MAFDDAMQQLLNSPGFNMGMALLGNTHNPNGLADAQRNMFAWQQGQLAQQQLAQEKAYREAQLAQQRQHESDINKLYQAQIGQYGQKTQNEAQQLKLLQRQQQIREAILKRMGSTLGFQIPPPEGDTGAAMPQQPQPDSGNPFNQQSLSPGEEILQPDDTSTPANIAPLDNSDGMQMPQLQAPQFMPQSAPASGSTGRHGTPVALLDNLRQIESGGNPKAVNPKTGALGAYQFMPATARALNAQGYRFNPMDEAQSRDAADYYLQQLVAKNGGDYRAALADYGGFKSKDPSQYVGKVLAGINLGGAPSSPVPVPGSAAPPNAGVGGVGGQTPQQLAQLGTLLDLAGLKGQGLYEQAKLAMPQNVPANSYRVDPNTGNSTYMPSPVEERRLKMEQQKQDFQTGKSEFPGVTPEDASKLRSESIVNQSRFVEKNYDKVSTIPDQLLAIQHAKQAYDSAKIFTGAGGQTKMNIVNYLNSNLGFMGVHVKAEELGNAELLRSSLFVPITSSLKQMDSTPSQPQQEAMQKAFGSMDTYRVALPKLLDMIEERLKNRLKLHNDMVDTVSKGGIPLDYLRLEAPTAMPLSQMGAFAKPPQPAKPAAAPPQATGVMTLDDYIKKHRRK
jgi:hypothetical protein